MMELGCVAGLQKNDKTFRPKRFRIGSEKDEKLQTSWASKCEQANENEQG